MPPDVPLEGKSVTIPRASKFEPPAVERGQLIVGGAHVVRRRHTILSQGGFDRGQRQKGQATSPAHRAHLVLLRSFCYSSHPNGRAASCMEPMDPRGPSASTAARD